MTMTSARGTWFRQLADARKGAPKLTIPQELADAWTEVMVEAVRSFHEPDFVMLPAMDYTDGLCDADIEKRIRGYQDGYDMEYTRKLHVADAGIGVTGEVDADKSFDCATEAYDFSKLPRPVQRAIVSHWDSLHHEFLDAHDGLSYYPDIGYVWLFYDDENEEVVQVPYRDADCGEMPEKDDLARMAGEPPQVRAGVTGEVVHEQ